MTIKFLPNLYNNVNYLFQNITVTSFDDKPREEQTNFHIHLTLFIFIMPIISKH